MGGSWDYLDFDLAVTRVDDGFEVRVLDSPAGETGAMRTTFDPDRAGVARDDVPDSGRSSPSTRDVGQSSSEPGEYDDRRIGEALFQAVFSGDVLTRYRDSVNRATAGGAGLRIVLRFGGGADVLPWELLRDGPVFLAATRRTAIVRCIEMPTRVAPPKMDGPLRILVAVSAPAGLAPIGARREHELLTGALSRWIGTGALEVVVLEDASLNRIRVELERFDVHVFHYIGHGTRLADGRSVLELTADDGSASPTRADELAAVLAQAPGLRLAVLNACHGAAGDVRDPFASAAASLVKAGVPAVIAMARTISDSAATVFAGELYGALARGARIDAAVGEGRRTLFSEFGRDWSTVALYLGSSLDAAMIASPLSTVDEDVQFTVSRPAQLRAAKWEPMLVFAHHGDRHRGPSGETVDQPSEVAARISGFYGNDLQDVITTAEDAGHALPRGTGLVVVPELPDVECDPPRASITWTGEIAEVRFLLRAADHRAGSTAGGWVRVFCGPLVIAETAVTLAIVDTAAATGPEPPTEQEVRRYRRIFPCFAPEDSDLVRGVVAVAESLGDRYMADVIDGQRGDAPATWMLPQIAHADVFQLFWSSNSMQSATCQQQWEAAIHVTKPDFIRPLYWEQPFPRAAGRPPPELETLHFVRVPVAGRAPVSELWAMERVPVPPSARSEMTAVAPGRALPNNRSNRWSAAGVGLGAILFVAGVSGLLLTSTSTAAVASDNSALFPRILLVAGLAVATLSMLLARWRRGRRR